VGDVGRKKMSIRETVGGGIMGLAGTAASVLGLVIHVWTIVIAFAVSGLVGAVTTLMFPVLGEVYWFFKVGGNAGFSTIYCISLMAYVGLFGIVFLGAKIANKG